MDFRLRLTQSTSGIILLYLQSYGKDKSGITKIGFMYLLDFLVLSRSLQIRNCLSALKELYLLKPIFAVLFLSVIPEYLLNSSDLLAGIVVQIEMNI